SPELRGASPANRRVRFDGFFSRMWLRFAFRRRSLPVPVILKRFAAPRWVFILGICRCVLAWRRLLPATAPARGSGRGLAGLVGARGWRGAGGGWVVARGCRFGLLLRPLARRLRTAVGSQHHRHVAPVDPRHDLHPPHL